MSVCVRFHVILDDILPPRAARKYINECMLPFRQNAAARRA